MIAKRLKNSVIDFAIKGDLTNREIEDESTIFSLNRLSVTKRRLETEKKIYKKKPTVPFYELDEIPIDIPDSWQWIQLSDVSIIQEGAGIRKYQYTEEGVQLLSVTNILDGYVDLSKKQLFVSTDEFVNKYTHLQLDKGDIVTACSGGSWGKVAIYEQDEMSMLNTSTLRLRFFDDIAINKFLYYIVKSEFFKKQLREQLVGMQPNFGYAHYSRIIIPFPPIEEQKRIVEKLDEILPLIDSLEKDELKLNELMQKFPESMKKSILRAAIQGKITNQNTIEQCNLKIKTPPIQSEIDLVDLDVPSNWKLAYLMDICRPKQWKTIPLSEINGGDYPVYGANGIIGMSKTFNHRDPTVLITCRGATCGNVNISKPYSYINGNAFALDDLNPNIDMYYLKYCFEGLNLYSLGLITGTAQPQITKEKINKLILPIPPLSEQRRIVEKLDTIFSVVENLNNERL